jgi:hypothetical protein
MAGTDLKHTLIDQVASYALDPLGFVLFAFPWGEAGTELADATAHGIGSASSWPNSAGACAKDISLATSCRS